MTTTASEAITGYNGLYASIAIIDPDTGLPGTGTDFSFDIKDWEEQPAAPSSDDLTYQEAKNGGAATVPIQVTLLQSLKTGSFWRFLRDNPGAKLQATIGYMGNATPTTDKPHAIYVVKNNTPPAAGTPASLETTRASSQVTLDWISGPTWDDGTGA